MIANRASFATWGALLPLLFAAACSDNSASPAASPTPSMASSAIPASVTAEPTEDPRIGGVLPIELHFAPAVPLPAGLILYALDAAWEGPSPGLRRYYVDADGVFSSDQLFVSRGDWRDPFARNLVGTAFGADAGSIVIDICSGGCYGSIDPITIARSDDGGVTWTDVANFPGGAVHAVAVEPDDIIIQEFDTADISASAALLRISAPREPLPLPAGLSDDPWFLAGPDEVGEMVVATLASDARSIVGAVPRQEVIAAVPETAFEDPPSLNVVRGDGVTWAVIWEADGRQIAGLLKPGASAFTAVLVSSHSGDVAGVHLTHWLDERRVLGRAYVRMRALDPRAPSDFVTGIPAIVDVTTGAVQPIEEFIPVSAGKAGGPVPVRVVFGEFVRVGGTGSCLNVREAPGASAATLACYADGVLLPVRTGVAAEGGWLAVSTLDGRTGWAAAVYLTPATSP